MLMLMPTCKLSCKGPHNPSPSGPEEISKEDFTRSFKCWTGPDGFRAPVRVGGPGRRAESLGQNSAPVESGAEGRQHDGTFQFAAAAAPPFRRGDQQRRGGRVAVTVHVREEALLGGAE